MLFRHLSFAFKVCTLYLAGERLETVVVFESDPYRNMIQGSIQTMS